MDGRRYQAYHGKRGGGLLAALGLLTLAASVLMYLTVPLNIQKFAAFPAILGVFLLLFGGAAYIGGRTGVIMGRVLAGLLAFLVALFCILEVMIIVGSRSELPEDEPDAVVVLGAQVHPWGPSVLLGDRLDTAYDYAMDHPEVSVIVSGGRGPDEHATEASVMRDYLVNKGLDAERIRLEEASHNTNENLMYTRLLLEEMGLDPDTARLVVVSNGFHLARVRMLAQRRELNAFTLAAPSSHFASKVQSYIREGPALVKSWIFDR